MLGSSPCLFSVFLFFFMIFRSPIPAQLLLVHLDVLVRRGGELGIGREHRAVSFLPLDFV